VRVFLFRRETPAEAGRSAGEALVVHTPSAREQAWQNLKETNPLLLKFGEWRAAYDESENPVVSSLRAVTSTVGGWFEETENAQVVRAFRALDPTFSLDVFERELREYIVPEVVDAYLSADGESLQKWCSEAVRFAVVSLDGRMLMRTADIQRALGNDGAVHQVWAHLRQQGTRYPPGRHLQGSAARGERNDATRLPCHLQHAGGALAHHAYVIQR
jgi:hypothetical protein